MYDVQLIYHLNREEENCGGYNLLNADIKTRASHALPTLVCQGPSFYSKFLVKKYSYQSYAPCLATAPCHDEQVFQIWC